MIGRFVILQLLFVGIQGSPIYDNILDEILENDPNLNDVFDLPAYRQSQLNLHNYYRGLHGVEAMIEDATLTTRAQDSAEKLAADNGDLTHCVLGCDNEGENLATGTNATKDWYDEVWFYDFCSKDKGLKRPGHSGEMVGHFTQVVWKGSTQLGIGYARNVDNTTVYVVARYSPAGNMQSTDQYKNNVLKPNYIFNTYQDNCDATSGGYTAWSAPGECTQSCGGGVKLQTRACTNPKPSLNGADCDGETAQLASQEWCNIQACPGDKTHLDSQCEERGKEPQGSLYFDSRPCDLYCLAGNTYRPAGTADDGTHCVFNEVTTGVCVQNVCIEMPDYVAPTTPPPTNPAGQTIGSYTDTPSGNWWENIFFQVPTGATHVTITNHNTNSVRIGAGYTSGTAMSLQWWESWGYTQYTVVGVSFSYSTSGDSSTTTIAGPVQPTSNQVFTFFAESLDNAPAHITWSYTP